MSLVRGQVTYLGTRPQMTIPGVCGTEVGPGPADCVRIFLVARRLGTGKSRTRAMPSILTVSARVGRTLPILVIRAQESEYLHPEYVPEPGRPKYM